MKESQKFHPYVHYGTEIEQDVIGICLIERGAISRAYGKVKPDYFYLDDHKKIFSCICEMYEKQIPIDLHTTTHYVVETFGQNLLGGNVPAVLAGCTNKVVSSYHLEYHCFLIVEMWKRREVIKLRTTYPEDNGFNPEKNLEDLSKQIDSIVNATTKGEWRDMSEVVYDLFIHQHEMAAGKKQFLTTGFKKLDQKNGGFYGGQMIVIGARPSVGKSALMGKMAISMAKQGSKVGIISLEMNNTEIAARLSSLDADIEFWKIFRTIAADEEMHRAFYDKVSRSLAQLPIFISDKTNVSMIDVRAKAMNLQATRGCDVLMIDYLQLIDTESGRQFNREQLVSQMSRGIKLLAKEMNIPVIVLCQLNRQQTGRSYEQRFPRLSDLRESGAIEQDADVVMFIHRDFMSGYEIDQEGQTTERKADLICAKWRNGAPCHLPLGFDPEKMNFFEETTFPTGYVPINYTEQSGKDEDPF